jgi:hypothetical protein
VLGDLLREERESLARIAVESAARAAAAVAPVAVGVPALEGSTSFASMMSAESSHYKTPAEEFGGRPAPRFLQEEIESGERQLAAAQAEAASKKAAREADR